MTTSGNPQQSALVKLQQHGLYNTGKVYWNLPSSALVEQALIRKEGHLSRGGPLVVNTGRHTSRAAADKWMVKEPSSQKHVWWGDYNKPFAPRHYEALKQRLHAYLQGRDIFVQDCVVGADPVWGTKIRIITETAWHSLFARNMFIPAKDTKEPAFTLICAPGFHANPIIDHTGSSTAICLHLGEMTGIIGNTGYGGEIKKSIFTLMNYLLPLRGVLTMHCSANVDQQGNSALFFGLSGTGKTTLSADPNRRLIGDDEHGWSDAGIFNFEGGCYAKVIRLSAKAEPQIHACTQRFGTILENVALDPITREIDLDDDHHTENTRASYPLEFIENTIPEKQGNHPKDIVMLTCDASGVLPPIARLTPEQALYHFISGYTAKVGGTEAGVGDDPQPTFSTCFGAPFMVHHPGIYAKMLGEKIARHNVHCWLLNTGWTGGGYRTGHRISIANTRTLLNAALSGALDNVPTRKDEIFGFEVPLTCEPLDPTLLTPAASWKDQEEYNRQYRALADLFIKNFEKFAPSCDPSILAAGPRR